MHLKDVLKYYDVVTVSPSFIEGVTIPKDKGFFFLVQPDQAEFWESRSEEFKHL